MAYNKIQKLILEKIKRLQKKTKKYLTYKVNIKTPF